jgi:CheY-like chemotaxis protein
MDNNDQLCISLDMSRVLFIDDTQAIRTLAQRVLGPMGHEVFVAADVGAGILIWQALGADLVITDLRMRGDGFQMIFELRASGPPIPIIITSGGNPEEDLKALRAVHGLGPLSYLTTPFTIPELEAVVRAALEPTAQEAPPSSG